MNAGGVSFFETGLWIIPLVLIGTLLGMYVLVRFWQNHTQQDLKTIQTNLRSSQSAIKQLQDAVKDYSSEDREPFGSQMKYMAEALLTIQQQQQEFQQRYGDIRQAVQRHSLKSWQALLGAAFFWFPWYQIRSDIKELQGEMEQARLAFASLRDSAQALSRWGWEIAGQARQTVEKERQAKEILDKLGDRRLYGNTFDAAVHQETKLRAVLAEIPPVFLNADETTLLAQADKETIADVHEVLSESGPQIDQLLERLRGWEKQYEEVAGRVINSRRALDEAASLAGSMPAEIIVQPFEAELKQLNLVADTLQSTLTRLEVENIGDIGQEADRVRIAAQDISDQLKRARRQLTALERILGELNDGLKTLSAQFATPATSAIRPLVWNRSRSQLTELSRQTAAIGVFKKPRLPEQVEKDLSASSTLLAQQKELSRHCQEIAQQHVELLTLLDSPELKQGLEWLKGAKDLAKQASAYAADNWPRADAVGALQADLAGLEDRQMRLVSGSPAEQILEMEIAPELEQLRALAGQHKSMRARVDRVRSRLGELQQIEKELRERYQTARNMLNQAELLARSNAFLDEIAAADIANYRNRLEQLAAELSQRPRGLVEDKGRQLTELTGQIEQAANSWLDRLNQDIEAKKKILASKVADIEQIAVLEERAISEARRALADDIPSSVAQRGKQKPVYPPEAVVAQLKQRSDIWQSYIAALRQIEDIENPLVETYQQTLKQYEATKEQLVHAANWASAKRSWPPTSQTLEKEIQEFNQLEAQWQEIESQPDRAISVVRKLGELGAKLQALRERTQRAVERMEQEQNRIQDLEGELDDLARRWQAVGQQYPEASGEARRIAAQAGQGVEDLKRQYRQGSLTYSQVYQAISSLCEKIENEQITLADGQIIRLDGDYKAYRRRY